MKKLLPVLLVLTAIVYLSGILSCRERVASNPSSEPSATITQTATITPTATTLVIINDFETAGSLNGWSLADTGFTSASQTTGTADVAPYHGAGCVGITCNFTGNYTLGTFKLDTSPSLDFTGKTISAHIYIPASMAGSNYVVTLFVLTGGSLWSNSWTSLSGLTTGWNTFTYSPSFTGINNVNRYGIQINQMTDPNISDTIYVDYITVQ
jgi:hypothetical protein